MSKYQSGMDKILVDAEMERRILTRLANPPAARPQSFQPRRYAAVAACFVLMLGVFVVTRFNNPTVVTNPNNPVQVVSPRIETAETLEALGELTDFELYAPMLPEEYEATRFSFHNGTVAEIEYGGALGSATYRTAAETSENISGDYHVYDSVATEELAGKPVTVSMNGALVYLLAWNDAGLSFSLSFESGVSRELCEEIIASMSPAG